MTGAEPALSDEPSVVWPQEDANLTIAIAHQLNGQLPQSAIVSLVTTIGLVWAAMGCPDRDGIWNLFEGALDSAEELWTESRNVERGH